MGRICLKCGYERQPSDDAVPDYECPMCGTVYKAEERKQQTESPPETPMRQKDDSQEKDEEERVHRFGFRKPGCLINIPSLSFLLPQTLELETAPEELPSASILQRILAGVTTFFYWGFIAAIVRYFAVLTGIQYLRQTGAFSRVDFLDAGSFIAYDPEISNVLNSYAGIGVIIGSIVALLILPLLWRGLSFGQRAMKLLVIPKSDRIKGTLSGSALMLLRLTFRTGTVSAEKLSRWSWTKILYPMAAILVLNYAVFLPITGILRMGDFFGDRPESTREPLHITEEMQHNMMVNELQRRAESGDETASEVLEDISQDDPGRRNNIQAEIARWRWWAESIRAEASSMNFGETMKVEAFDSGYVYVTTSNIERIIEEARPE